MKRIVFFVLPRALTVAHAAVASGVADRLRVTQGDFHLHNFRFADHQRMA